MLEHTINFVYDLCRTHSAKIAPLLGVVVMWVYYQIKPSSTRAVKALAVVLYACLLGLITIDGLTLMNLALCAGVSIGLVYSKKILLRGQHARVQHGEPPAP